jgi:thiamine pyrophosphate-dependent acetolactate synthase large subunit-like protein
MYLMALGCHMPLALGVALGLPQRNVVCLETDGSALMNLGILATLGNQQPKNLKIFVFDNEIYECIGGPPTHTSGQVDLADMARGAGITEARTVRTEGELREAAEEALTTERLHFVVAKVEPGVKEGLPRKKTDGIEDKYLFARYLEDTEGITVIPPSQHN